MVINNSGVFVISGRWRHQCLRRAFALLFVRFQSFM